MSLFQLFLKYNWLFNFHFQQRSDEQWAQTLGSILDKQSCFVGRTALLGLFVQFQVFMRHSCFNFTFSSKHRHIYKHTHAHKNVLHSPSFTVIIYLLQHLSPLTFCIYNHLYIKYFLHDRNILFAKSGGCGSNCSGWMHEWMGSVHPWLRPWPWMSVRSTADLHVTRRQLLVHHPESWGDFSALDRQWWGEGTQSTQGHGFTRGWCPINNIYLQIWSRLLFFVATAMRSVPRSVNMWVGGRRVLTYWRGAVEFQQVNSVHMHVQHYYTVCLIEQLPKSFLGRVISEKYTNVLAKKMCLFLFSKNVQTYISVKLCYWANNMQDTFIFIFNITEYYGFCVCECVCVSLSLFLSHSVSLCFFSAWNKLKNISLQRKSSTV